LYNFKEILPEKINNNIFNLIGKDWMLIGASDGEKTNAMTASWGGAGVLWNKNVVYCFIRPQRYTKEFVDKTDCFTLSFFDESYREMLGYFGRVSGRDEDKISVKGLNLNLFSCDEVSGKAPVFDEARLTIVCKKLYNAPMVSEGFTDKSLIDKNYALGDFHMVYVGEIIKVLEK